MSDQTMSDAFAHAACFPNQVDGASADWQQHEHVAPAIELEAQQLIDHAGSPDLAKQAIEAASQHQLEPRSAADELAMQLGFPSRGELLAASTPLMAQDGIAWWVTEIRTEGWIVWNDQGPAAAQHFSSREALNQYVCENAGISPQ